MYEMAEFILKKTCINKNLTFYVDKLLLIKQNRVMLYAVMI